jgi:exodeoxyribonuclease V beta subunit
VSEPRDPFLDLPLEGVRLIEASAGTGKTFTLATLVVRLVVERGLRVGDILAVTYTEAATQELRRRIRERLQLALDLFDAPEREGEGAAATLTRRLLEAQRARGVESDDALKRRLRQATLDVELAAVFTIHGFCARVLREHALESGHAFDAPELLADDRELRAELAADLWRAHAQDEAGAEDLEALWKGGYEELAKDLPALLREPVLLPPDASLPREPQPALQQAAAALADAFRAHGDGFRAALLAAVEDGVLHAGSYKGDWIDALFAEARAWCEAGDPAASFDHPKLANLRRDTLSSRTNAKGRGRTPDSPLCDAVADYAEALAALEDWKQRRRAALLHRIRDDARARFAGLKRQRRLQTYDDMIDGVADALSRDDAGTLARALRGQYAVALVDEFQDTDARQWAIFDRVFGGGSVEPALFLIGDPKQAIYGFRGGDVHAYLAAAGKADKAPALAHNFRSRPAVLAAIAALYANAGAAAFVDPRIEFRHVEAGGKRHDADFLHNGTSAPALTAWQAPPPAADEKGRRKPHGASHSRELATRACVAAIHALLSDARAGKSTIDGRAVQPGDIAVLVRTHREATQVRQALALAGIPAVAAGKQGLFATAEARELQALLLALLHSGDDARLRAALATVLLGLDAGGVDALDRDADAHRAWQQRALGWRERLARGGPLALVGELCAEQAPRLLGLLDGERRLSNYLQLAELLQEAQARTLGLHGLVDWLQRRIAEGGEDETQLLRLESDARRVQVVTLHKSKGLEYPLVFLPFAGIGRNEKSPGRYCIAHDARDGRRLHWKLGLAEAEWDMAKGKWQAEQRAEDARLLYVALTRAEHALWIASGEFFAHDKSPLHAMLGDEAALREAGVVFDTAERAAELPRLAPESDAAIPPARAIARRIANDWWVHSFSQLSKADAGLDTSSAATLPAAGGNDEPDAGTEPVADAAFDPRFAGNRYGVALHAALEHADFAAWREWRAGDIAPADEAGVIADALRGEGYGADALDDGLALTTQLIGHTLTVALPEGVRLCELPSADRRPEIEFQFALQATRVDALLALLHAHGVLRERQGFGLRHRLEGLMTGLIDLTYRHDGKWYVLDYKSNRLPAYDAPALQRAMQHSEYDLQALLYTLAVHRWLRFRLGDGYDYARDFGGIRYLFCRGLDAARADSPGIHAQRFAPELVHALDALFGSNTTPPRAGDGQDGGKR